MPPVTMIGVRAMARRPSSTLRRMISKKFSTLRKRGAMALKSTSSTEDRD
jgi:hypothetical protein